MNLLHEPTLTIHPYSTPTPKNVPITLILLRFTHPLSNLLQFFCVLVYLSSIAM